MAIKDTLTKDYLSQNDIFADIVNYTLYDGEERIKSKDLTEKDATEIVLPFGDDGKLNDQQRWRDLLKEAIIKKTDVACYLMIGMEAQSEIHYAMPVRSMLYDSMTYASQIKSIANLHKKNKQYGTAGEFMSGFHKNDCLIPVITITVYFGNDEWDGPRTLRSMFRKEVFVENVLERYIPDYPAMILVPKEIEDFEKFRSEFRCVAELIKNSNEGKQIIEETLERDENFKHMSREAVAIINEFAGMKIEIREEEREMDVCKAWKENTELGIEQGVKLINKLILILAKEGRFKDIAKSAEDPQYQEQLLKEYNLK